jgi:hypothetical protein
MQLLQASADAHGWRAFSQLTDFNVSYEGRVTLRPKGHSVARKASKGGAPSC